MDRHHRPRQRWLRPCASSGARHWELEWPGPLGGALDAMQGLAVSDIEIEPFKLEDYVLKVYSGTAGARD